MRIIAKVEKQLYDLGINSYIIQTILQPARKILEDHKFWLNQDECLVVFMAENFFEFYQLPVSTEIALYIDTEFKVEPLAKMMENTSFRQSDISEFRISQKIA